MAGRQGGEYSQQCQDKKINLKAIHKRKIILIGGGGHCKSSIDVILSTGLYTIAGILDRKEKVGEQVLGFAIIATDDDLDTMKKKCDCFAITVGQIKTAAARMNIYNRLKAVNADLPFIVAATAHVSSLAEIASGTMVFHHALINASVKVGENCIINSGALIEHDAIVGNHCHISTAAVLNGNVNVKDESFIGSNASILQGITIGYKSIVGAGSWVSKNVSDKTIVAGNPAKHIGTNE